MDYFEADLESILNFYTYCNENYLLLKLDIEMKAKNSQKNMIHLLW